MLLLFLSARDKSREEAVRVFIGPQLPSSHSELSKLLIFDTDCPFMATTVPSKTTGNRPPSMAIINVAPPLFPANREYSQDTFLHQTLTHVHQIEQNKRREGLRAAPPC